MYATGVSQYGQMTAGSFCYIGPQGIVHGTTLTLLNAGRKYLGTVDDLAGKLFVTAGLGGMSGAQAKAAVVCGAVTIVAEVSKEAVDTGELLDMDVAYQDGIADDIFGEDLTDWGPRCQKLWLDLGLAATGWAWQRDTVALTVALVTGNNTAFGRGMLDETDDWCGWVGSNMDRAMLV